MIKSLDKNDYHDYYKSENRRYLLLILKNSDYNFSTKDESVYDLYVSFNMDFNTIYAAILE